MFATTGLTWETGCKQPLFNDFLIQTIGLPLMTTDQVVGAKGTTARKWAEKGIPVRRASWPDGAYFVFLDGNIKRRRLVGVDKIRRIDQDASDWEKTTLPMSWGVVNG